MVSKGFTVHALVAAAALWVGCQRSEYRLVLSYPDQAAYDRARRVELIIGQQASCAVLQGGNGDRRLDFDAHGDMPALGQVGFGRAAFLARVRAGDCAIFLQGCSEAELTADRDTTVRIPLIAVAGGSCASSQRCLDGQCLTGDAAIADAGGDAHVDAHFDARFDAHVDAHTDGHLDARIDATHDATRDATTDAQADARLDALAGDRSDAAADASADRSAVDSAAGDSAVSDHAIGADVDVNGWWNDSWSRRRRLTFDNRSQPETLSDFAVLLRLDSSRIDYSANQDWGEDLRFVDADGTTVLAHEIEHWHAWGETLIWVKVPAIDASSNSDSIWMYYGNGAAADGQQPAAVWTSDFAAVYHLDNLDDSTGNAYHGTDDGTTQDVGSIGWGRWFDGSGSNIHLPDDTPYLDGVSSWTISIWIRPDRFLASRYPLALSVFDSAPPTTSSRASFQIFDDGEVALIARAADSESSAQYLYLTGGPLALDGWSHLVGVTDYAGGLMSLYLDGQFRSMEAKTFSQATASNTNSSNGAIGAEDNGAEEFFAGFLDEIRIVRSARSSSWIRAEHLSETDAFVRFGSEETP